MCSLGLYPSGVPLVDIPVRILKVSPRDLGCSSAWEVLLGDLGC